MAKLKIISNPYKKEIRYQQWNEKDGEWVEITYATHSTSKLLCKDFTEGFFPFKVKQIVDQIISDYETDDGAIKLEFEGSTDEYNELEAICKQPVFEGKVTAARSENTLANARDILPEVKGLFQQMSPLISICINEKIQSDLERFADASSDVVPICVLGNYSSGKSTFINALIGHEILPNGINPVTARIFKISRSKYPDRAHVRFQYLDQPVALYLTENESYFEGNLLPNDLTALLEKEVISLNGESIVVRMNKAISIINDYRSNEENTGISDLIEIEIPFEHGVLAQSQHPFVIFDTPGSNSASNARHLKILKQAMANMTNGLPIFLATPDTLDSTDNENLYKIIRDLDELDSRFTMIVVNKADKNDLNRRESSEEEEKLVLRQAIPRNLYSGGLFYVSSIMGLGSKNNGQFFDDFYDETYEDQERKYNDPDNRRYKRLYLYNIMPAQIKARSNAASAKQSSLVYANSGLFSVESEIEQFAGKYAAYNKCVQSQLFLGRVIQSTGEEITSQREDCEGIRKSISDKLDEDKQRLIGQLEQTSKYAQNDDDAGYAPYMEELLQASQKELKEEELNTLQQTMTEETEQEFAFDACVEINKNAVNAVGKNLLQHVEKAAKNFSASAVKSVVENLRADVNAAVDSGKSRSEVRHQVDQEVARRLLEKVKQQYQQHLIAAYQALDQQSQQYWSDCTEQLRTLLAQIVSGANEVLTDERQQELKNIIITYQKITFDVSRAEAVFQQDEFAKKFALGGFVLWQDDHLNLGKLCKTYNREIQKEVQKQYESIAASHQESGHLWIQSLLDEIRSNIVKYSPELSRQAKQIQTMTKKIEELIARQEKLEQYREQLMAMMDWKTTE